MPAIGSSVSAIGARDRLGVMAPGGMMSSLGLVTSTLTIPNRLRKKRIGIHRVDDRMRNAITAKPHAGYVVALTSAYTDTNIITFG